MTKVFSIHSIIFIFEGVKSLILLGTEHIRGLIFKKKFGPKGVGSLTEFWKVFLYF